MLKKDKKGFTLAELLIVVAIIGVLVAIAVPLFVGALNNAKDKTLEANVRAVRGAAVAQILLCEANTSTVVVYKDTEDGGTELSGPWYVDATVSSSGEVKITGITNVATGKDSYATDASSSSESGGTYTIKLKIEALT